MNTRDTRDYLAVEAHITQCFPILSEAEDAARDNVLSVWASGVEESTKIVELCGHRPQFNSADVVAVIFSCCRRAILKEDETHQKERLNRGLALSNVHYVFTESL
jgi:hypothetical protein